MNLRFVLLIIIIFISVYMYGQDVIKLPSDINTERYDEIAFMADTAGKQFFFTRTGSPDLSHVLYQNGYDVGSNASDEEFENKLSLVYSEISGQPVIDPIASGLNQDIYLAEPGDDGSWIVRHPGYPINSALPNSAVGVLENPVGLFVLNHFLESGNMKEGISKMYFGGDGEASFPAPIFVQDIDNRGSDINVFVTADGEVALMALHRTGGPQDSDLYVSFYTGDGDRWTRPKNLSIDINTKYRESTPFLSRDKRHLYFASNRPGGEGGTDIYVSNRLSYTYTKWSEPKLLNHLVNTKADESHPHYVSSAQDLYFSSNRHGSFDVFKYKPVPKKKIREIIVTGRIKNKETGVPTGAKLFYGPESIADYLEYYDTFNGRFKIVVTTAEEFKFFAKRAGYETRIQRFNFEELVPPDVSEYEIEIFLYPKKEGNVATDNRPQDNMIFNMTVDELKERKTISLHNIQFTRSKASVLQKSKPYLDEIYRLLHENDDIYVRITGHTDNQGARDLLMKLSEDRARAIKDYLVLKGIDAKRIRTLGVGPDHALNANENERDRSLNRRVEITILDM